MKALLRSGAAICALFSLLVPPLHAQPGSLDMTFNPGSGANGPITCMAPQTNGQIVIGGYFSSFNGSSMSHVGRLNSDGSVDSTFYPGVGPNGTILSTAVQPDGKILVCGGYSQINGLQWNQPARFRTDGSLDLSFDTSFADGGGASGNVQEILLQPDGKVLVAGGSITVSNTQFGGIVRLQTNAALDEGFNMNIGITNGQINAIGLQSTGNIIIGGIFTAFDGVTQTYLSRLLTDGSLDTTFNADLQNGSVVALAVTPQDQIVIVGAFTSINGYSRNGIARLNSDGSIDASFVPGLGVNGSVLCVALQTNGEVVIGGNFSAVNNVSAHGVARLATNGSVDMNFASGANAGANNSVLCLQSQPDGKTIIAGSFYSFNGTNINYIARLNGDGALGTSPQFLSANLYFGAYLYGTATNTYRIEWTSDLATPSLWTPLFDVTLQSNSLFFADPNPPTGQRFYRAVQLP